MEMSFFVLLALLVASSPKPNVVFILADDLGYSDVGCFGGEIETPHLDRLASEGLRYTQFYNTARCWPSRAVLLTGYYAQQINRDPQGRRPMWAALLPELLAPAGYTSYHSGKWHVDGPVLEGGFSRSYLLGDHNRNFNPRDHKIDDKPLPPVEKGSGYYSTTAITDRAIEWLDQHQKSHEGSPFFLYVAYTVPHFPLHAPASDVEKYRTRYGEGWDVHRARRHQRLKEMGIVDAPLSERTPGVPAWESMTMKERDQWASRMAVHAAMVDRMDVEIGRLIDRLDAQGVLDDTLIIFCSDNGASGERLLRGDGHDPSAPLGSAGTFVCLEPGWANHANSPFRKSKMFTHEGGIATPMIVRWGKGIKAKGELRRMPSHLIDIAPTLLELAGVVPPESVGGHARPPLPGVSLVGTFASDQKLPRDPIFFKHQGNRALRDGDWKIVASGPGSRWELYDLSVDRTETRDLSAEHPGKVEELSAKWEQMDRTFAEQGKTAPRKDKATLNE